jgi:hypothetical protein
MGRKAPIGQDTGPIFIEGHRPPLTRRQFLAQGMIAGAAMVTAPSLLGLLAGRGVARAQMLPCTSPVGGTGMIPFICFDLAGGANIAGSNVLVGGPAGQEDLLSLSGYSKLGLPADLTPQQAAVIDSEFGLLFHDQSAMLAGIRAKTSTFTRSQINGAVFCSRSLNDTENNELNPMQGIAAVGADGGLLTLVGSRTTDSGGKSISPMHLIDDSLKPTTIREGAQARGLVDSGRMAEFLGEYGAVRVLEAIQAISDRKIDRLVSLGEDTIATDMLRASYANSVTLVKSYGDPNLLDPHKDLVITGLPGSILSEAEINHSNFRATAAIMKLVVNQHVGAGCIQLGGYDYHDSTRATGEARDRAAGEAIGACLEYAARSCNDLVVYVFSDGSVSSDGLIDDSAEGGGKGIWRTDNSSTSAAFMLVYSKDEAAGRPTMVADPSQLATVRQQIGHFTSDGSVSTDATELSNSPASLSEAVILNYLALHGLDSQFESRLPNWTLGQMASRNDLIAFEPIRTP